MHRIGKMLLIILAAGAALSFSQTIKRADWEDGRPISCTTITVGRLASADGSVIASGTTDSSRTRGIFGLKKSRDYPSGAKQTLVKRVEDDSSKAMPAWKYVETGTIPQVKHTYGYINTAYPVMNEHQLAVTESTIGYRKGLRSDKGLLDNQQLFHLLLQRCTTAREAIKLADELTKRYGWNDWGECFTIADTKEVWQLEIVGPGEGKVGAVWAAQRVPDDHVHVCGNGSRIRQIDLADPDYFMASDNIFKLAKEKGWWNPDEGPFEFCYAYAPNDRTSLGSRRREWRALSLLAPSLELHPESENYPFSVKPDEPVTLEKLRSIYQDYYEETAYDMTKNIRVKDDSGKSVVSPFANPFMPYDMMKIFHINGGMGEKGERTIPRSYTQYAVIAQLRGWLPDEIGGVVWIDWDNPATSIYVPFYNSVTDIPKSYKVSPRKNGYTRESAWWAFNRLSGLVTQKWGDMRHDYEKIFNPLQKQFFAEQKEIDEKALALFKEDPDKAKEYLTSYCKKSGNKAVEEAWKLGDFLWTKYDGKF